MRNEIFMNFHFPARTATCAATHDGSALSVTLRALRDGQLLVPPQKTPCAFGATSIRKLTPAEKSCFPVGAAL